MKFTELKLPKPILRALQETGYESPTPIQEKAIPPALEGRDVLGCARTGTGKTCAFATPILTRLSRTPEDKHPIRALVLTPTRELALQNQQCFEDYGKYLPLRSAVIFGGVGQGPQVEALERGTDILVATPGRLGDLYQQGHIDLTHLEIFVLDEADRMLDMGFIHDVKRILQWLPEKKQTLFFSATMPQEVRSLVNSLLHNPVRIAVDPVNSTVDAIEQRLYRTDRGKKLHLLVWLLKENHYPSVLVFTRTKHGANRVARDLGRAGITAAAIHGNKSQTARQQALSAFKEGKLRVLVATDIAARGLDIEGLSCVVNYNLPDVPETYVHRIGRTGRAGQDGVALSFCDISEMEELAAIEKQLKRPIPEVTNHPYPMEELEVPMKDKHGKRINPEDQEARSAARERNRQRREEKAAQSADRQPAKAPENKSGETPRQEQKAPKPQKQKQPRPAPAVKEPELSPEEDVGSYEDWVRYRTMNRQPERKPYSAEALDELLALPDYADELGYGEIGKGRKKAGKGISGGKVMDATARLFLRGDEAPEEEAPAAPSGGEKRSRRRRGKNRSAQSGGKTQERTSKPAPAKAAPAPKAEKTVGGKQNSGEGKNRSRRRQGEARKPQSVEKIAQKQAAQSKAPAPQKGKGKRRGELRKNANRQGEDSGEESRSLIRPFYLSDTRKG